MRYDAVEAEEVKYPAVFVLKRVYLYSDENNKVK